jgi:hypothetical protein
MTNPLLKYYRVPKLYVKLPSNLKWYDPSQIKTSINNEIAVYPMSALDHITIKTPDALLNGEALLNVIKNCVPDVQDPRVLVEPDINTLLLAIRIATVGPVFEIDVACPKCNHENHYNVDLQAILDAQTSISEESEVNLDDELLINLRPYNMEQRNLSMLNEIEQSQAVRIIDSEDTISETEKMTKLGQLITKMAERTFDIAAKSISEVSIVSTGESVVNTETIRLFLKGIQSKQADLVIDRIKSLNRAGIDLNTNFQCQSCNHTWTHQLDFDPASFFG